MSIQFVRNAHDDALYLLGEWAIFLLKWRAEDHAAGLVGRCESCFLNEGSVAEVYQQPSDGKCPECFGTSFSGDHGGIKARLIRPSIWNPNTEEHAEQKRGEIIRNSAMVQTTSDFKMRVGDWMVRVDATRWRMRQPSTSLLRDGFVAATPEITNVGYVYGQVDKEDESSVAYIVPIHDQGVASITEQELLSVNNHYLPDFSPYEFIDGPLFGTGD